VSSDRKPGPEGDFFTLGEPLKPLGEILASKGIYLKGFWGSTLYANVSGGTQRTKVVYNEAFYGADFDLERIAGLTGTVIHFSLDSRFGGIPQGVNNLSGSAVGYLQGAGPNNETRLNELSIDQHLFNDRIRFVVGRTTLASYFATSDLYCQFLVGTCSNIGPFTWSENSNSPFWPIAVWAGEVAVFPTPETYIRVAHRNPTPTSTSARDFRGTRAGAHRTRPASSFRSSWATRRMQRPRATPVDTISASPTIPPILRISATTRRDSCWHLPAARRPMPDRPHRSICRRRRWSGVRMLQSRRA
jgi:hypothetical protein